MKVTKEQFKHIIVSLLRHKDEIYGQIELSENSTGTAPKSAKCCALNKFESYPVALTLAQNPKARSQVGSCKMTNYTSLHIFSSHVHL